MTKNATGANFDIVNGYKGTAEILVAIERGEAEGICGIDWSSFKTQRPQWLRDKTAHVIIQAAAGPNAELAALNVPNVDVVRQKRPGQARPCRWSSASRSSRGPMWRRPACRRSRSRFCATPSPPCCTIRNSSPMRETARLSINPATAETVQQTVEKLYARPLTWCSAPAN